MPAGYFCDCIDLRKPSHNQQAFLVWYAGIFGVALKLSRSLAYEHHTSSQRIELDDLLFR